MELKPGQLAPDFFGIDIYGKEVRLSDFRGKKIILGFFRNVNCPFCNRRVHQIMGNNVRLKQKDVQMVFLFESSNEKLLKSVFHQGISPWPLIGDPDQKIYKKYGVGSSLVKMMRTFFAADMKGAMKEAKTLGLPEEKDKNASMTLIPADFFINEQFIIEKAHYGRHLDDHIDFDELKAFAGIV